MFECLRGGGTAGACCVWVFIVPGGVSGQVTFSQPHLMDPACNKLVQAHERVRGESQRVGVVGGGGQIFCPSV